MHNTSTISSTEWIWFCAILSLSVFTFSPGFEADFVNWDDNALIYDNPNILQFEQKGTVQGLKDIFTTPVVKIYTPTTILSFVLEHKMWGMDRPELWHMDNLIFHLIVVLLVWLVSRQLGLNQWSALFVAALFAMHPMRVESVMWVSERKDTLYSLFYFLGLYAYLRRKPTEQTSSWTWIVWVSYILALFTKVLAVSFPLVLIVIDLFRGERLSIKLILRKTPYFIIGLGFGILALYFAKTGELTEETTPLYFSMIERFALAGYAIVVYLIKLIYPFEMLPIYLYPDKVGIVHYMSLCVWISLITILGYNYFKKKDKAIFFGLSFFIVVVFFMLQIIPVGHAFMADRFTYVAYFGLFFLVGKSIDGLLQKYPNTKLLLLSISGIVIAGYSWMSFRQSQIWTNSEQLWHHQIASTPELPTAWRNLYAHYEDIGAKDKFEAALIKSHKLEPDHIGTIAKVGKMYAQQSNPETQRKGLDYLSQAIAQDSSYAGIYINRAALYVKLNEIDLALADLAKAISLNDKQPDAYFNRAVLYYRQAAYEEALINLDRYLSMRPNEPDRWIIKGQMHLRLNQPTKAVTAIEQALQLDHDNGLYHFEMAIAAYQNGEYLNASKSVNRSRALDYIDRKELGLKILNALK